MKRFIFNMAFLALATAPVYAQNYSVPSASVQKYMEETQKAIQQSYGPYKQVAEAARKKLSAEISGATITNIGCFPSMAKGYYQVKLASKAYIIEYNYRNNTKRTIEFDSANAPASVWGRMSADLRSLFVIASKGKDGLTSIFMYNPNGGVSLVTKCKSVKCKEYYVEVEQLPGSEFPDKNMFTYDGFRIAELTNDPRNPILQMSKGDDFDPFDEDLIDSNGYFDEDAD